MLNGLTKCRDIAEQVGRYKMAEGAAPSRPTPRPQEMEDVWKSLRGTPKSLRGDPVNEARNSLPTLLGRVVGEQPAADDDGPARRGPTLLGRVVGGQPVMDDDELARRGQKVRSVSSAPSSSSSCSTAAPPTPSGPLADLRCDLVQVDRTLEQDYEFSGKVLGSGMNGAVREAISVHTQKAVAIKTMNLQSMTPEALCCLRREIELQAMLQEHPGIVRLEAVYVTDSKAFLVMEPLLGGEMYDRIRRWSERRELTEGRASRIMKQLLEIMAHMHEKGVMHRDIKPENMVLQTPGGDSFKLIDFGFAVPLRAGERLTERCGTIQYAAPEVVRKPACYNEKADIWSAGCVAHALLTGRNMYIGSQNEILRKSVRGCVDFAGSFWDLSPEARDFVESLLATNPNARPSAAEALRHPWLNEPLARATWDAKLTGPPGVRCKFNARAATEYRLAAAATAAAPAAVAVQGGKGKGDRTARTAHLVGLAGQDAKSRRSDRSSTMAERAVASQRLQGRGATGWIMACLGSAAAAVCGR